MKQGNQFYLEFQIEDENSEKLDITSVSKVQFNIGNITKTYDGENDEVTYENDAFKVWLTEDETFGLDKKVKMDARVMFKGDKKTIGGTYIMEAYWYDSLKQERLDV
nr:MAG TPA: hypothetical protein [Caudoviricetes sp.]